MYKKRPIVPVTLTILTEGYNLHFVGADVKDILHLAKPISIQMLALLNNIVFLWETINFSWHQIKICDIAAYLNFKSLQVSAYIYH